MFGTKRRRIADLEQRNELLVDQVDDARKDAAAWKWAAKYEGAGRGHADRYRAAWRAARRRAAGWKRVAQHRSQLIDNRDTRIDRLARACARYRTDLAVQQRVTDRLTDQLMDAMGYPEALRNTLNGARPTRKEHAA